MARFTREDKRTARVMQYERTAQFEVDYHEGNGFEPISTATALVRLAGAYKDVALLIDGWTVGDTRRTSFATYRRKA